MTVFMTKASTFFSSSFLYILHFWCWSFEFPFVLHFWCWSYPVVRWAFIFTAVLKQVPCIDSVYSPQEVRKQKWPENCVTRSTGYTQKGSTVPGKTETHGTFLHAGTLKYFVVTVKFSQSSGISLNICLLYTYHTYYDIRCIIMYCKSVIQKAKTNMTHWRTGAVRDQ